MRFCVTAHSEDLRRRVVKFIRQGGSKAEASRRYAVDLRTIYAWMGRGDDQTPRKPGPKGAHKIDMKKLAAMIGSKGADRTLKEMAKEFSVDPSAISRALRRLGVRRKKKPDVTPRRKHYEKDRRRFLKRPYKAKQEKRDIVFIDETGFCPTPGRTHGWSFIGQKIYGDVPGHTRPRTSLIGGHRDKKLIAPMTFDGTCNADVLNAWLASEFLPALKRGTVIFLDNATFHKSQLTIDLVKLAGCTLLFPPPYSPHLNPIEKLWANIKRTWGYAQDASLNAVIKSCC